MNVHEALDYCVLVYMSDILPMFWVWSIKIFMNFDYYYVLPIIKDYYLHYKRKYYSHFVIQYFINK